MRDELYHRLRLRRRDQLLLDFGHRHAGNVAEQQQEPEQEPCRAAGEDRPLEDRRPVRAPRVSVVVARQRRDDDDEALGPHADVDHDRDREQRRGISPDLAAQQRQRRDRIAGECQPDQWCVGAHRPEDELTLLRLFATVPGEEQLAQVGIADDQRHRDEQLRHLLEMIVGDVVADAEQKPARDDQRQNHRQTGENRAGDKVGSKDRAVPSGDDGDGEVPRDDAVHRNHQGGDQAGQQRVGRSKQPPLLGGAEPSGGQPSADSAAPPGAAIANDRKIGNETEKPEQHAGDEIGPDGAGIPDQGRAEVHPQPALVRIGNQPVEAPRPSQVQDRKQARRHDRHNRHRFGGSCDGRPPPRPEEKQDG